MVDVQPTNKTTSVSVSSSGTVSQIKTTTPQSYFDGLSKQWAISDDKVQGLDYSSKYYAQKAQENSQGALNALENVESVTTNAIQQITTTKNETVDSIYNISNQKQQEITELEETLKADLEVTKTNAVDKIENTRSKAVSEIETLSEETLSDIRDLGVETRAKTSLNNLTKEGKNIGNWSTNLTNCNTELPQNIKLELADGVLTLKKGSKVTVPNGPNVFDELVIDTDKTFTSTADGTFAILVNTTTKAMVVSVPSKTISGESDSLSTITYRTWYDTANNLVKRYNANASTIDHYCSLPIAMITVLNGAISSIDEVFNGLGYIGSNIWVDKGIKYLIPNGRNEDGSLNNIEVTTTNVTTQTIGANTYYITLANNGAQGKARKADTFFQDETPLNYMTNSTWFKPSENQWYRYTNGQWIKIYICPIGEFTANSSRVTNFKTYNAFRAVDYNDKEQIGTWSLPSAKYTDLTLGASGSAYTMPVNGWLYFLGDWNNQSTYIQIQNVTKGYKLQTPSISALGYYGLMMPVSMGDSIKISYTVAPTNVTLRIMHLQGEL